MPKISTQKLCPVCRKPWNFSFVSLNAVIKTVRFQISTILFIFFEVDVRLFEIRITAWRKRDQNWWHSFPQFSADCFVNEKLIIRQKDETSSLRLSQSTISLFKPGAVKLKVCSKLKAHYQNLLVKLLVDMRRKCPSILLHTINFTNVSHFHCTPSTGFYWQCASILLYIVNFTAQF